MRPLLHLAAAFALPLSGAATSRPNVLFIAIDDLNTSALGLGGVPAAKTPHLDALGERGVVFSNAHCAAPVCNPSRASVMTGVSPATSGLYRNRQDWRESRHLSPLATIPDHFRSHGYRVAGGGKLYHAANLSARLATGYIDPDPWHTYFPSKSLQLPDAIAPKNRTVNSSTQFYGGRFDWDPLDIPDSEMGDGQVVAWAKEQLSQNHEKPLFLAVGIYRPHIPWYTPKKWFDLYPPGDLALPDVPEDDLSDVPEAGRGLTKRSWHEWIVENGKWEQAVQAYLASASFADAMVGELVAALDAGPLAGNTLVVVWSDHGYHLGHKKHWEKRVLWDQATRVPLIVADHRFPGTAGERCAAPVSLLDLYPTLVDLCGLAPVAHLEGESLRPHLENPAAESGRAVVTTFDRGNHSVRSRHWRYTRYADGSEELYDHRADPGEFHNLAAREELRATIEKLAASLPARDAPHDPPQGNRENR